ncbi:putative disease resistance protein [Nymphaea thermarum]|nr:putative disease resistance protein [Nymphaea thermarum]
MFLMDPRIWKWRNNGWIRSPWRLKGLVYGIFDTLKNGGDAASDGEAGHRPALPDLKKLTKVKPESTAVVTLPYRPIDVFRHEATLVEKVVHHLLRHLDSGHLFVADHPVGMESRINDMMKLLQIERNGVKMVGLVGAGGIGKTTIAKAVFNELHPKFGAATFLSNIRESWKHVLSKTQLMKQLMEEIMDDRVTQIHNLDAAQRLFRDRIPPNKVLIVLDDVDHLDQFKVLIGQRLPRFASGSRIIMTTRNESVLSLCKVDGGGTYKPELLDCDQSLHLFRRYAFQCSHQQQDMYEDIQRKVVAVAGGLPLALRVFGSYLSDKCDRDEWKDYLDKLQQTPEQDIQKCLQISYDGLYAVEKEIFLDIACFFIGHDQVQASVMWESLNWQPRSAIKALQKKSLITVRGDGKLDMHDLIRDMGRDVRQAEPYKPWIILNAFNIFKQPTTTEA